MQNIVYPDVATTSSYMTLPVSISPPDPDKPTDFFKSVPTVSLVDLGKKLLQAATNGNVDQVRFLMTKGAPFTTDWLGTSPLHLAAQGGHLTMCEILLRAGISRDAKTKVDRTPLHMAVYEGHAGIVKLLLESGADVNCQDLLKMTPLHWAAEKEYDEIVELLLQFGADSCAVSKFCKTPFSIALEKNNLTIMQMLQDSTISADINSRCLEATERQSHEDMSINMQLVSPSCESIEETVLASDSIAAELGQVISPPRRDHVNKTSAFPIASISNSSQLLQNSTRIPLILKTDESTATNRSKRAKRPHEQNNVVIDDDSSSNITDPSSTLELLQAHGITMLPTDEMTLVASALQSGQTVVLTEAGKLALNFNQQQSENSPPPPKIMAIPVKKKKMITIKAGQLFSADGNTNPNIIKTLKSPIRLMTSSREHVPVTVSPEEAAALTETLDYETMTAKLEEARKENEKYKILLAKKVKEAELYKQKLQSLASNSS